MLGSVLVCVNSGTHKKGIIGKMIDLWKKLKNELTDVIR